MLQKFLLTFLKVLAKSVIKKHNPMIVGMTGSIGKTTTRNFVIQSLEKLEADVLIPKKNYNGEFGLPLTILESKSGGKNPLSWMTLVFKWGSQMLRKNYPKILVLEYGIDRPGEMDFMCDVVEPDIIVFTTLSPSHIQNFDSEVHYLTEKKRILRQQSKQTKSIISNHDDPYQANILSTLNYGTSDGSGLRISDIQNPVEGLRFTLESNTEQHSISTSIPGKHNAYTVTPAIAVLVAMGYTFEQITTTLPGLHLPHGRGNILRGIKESIIVDGTYNGGFEPIVAGCEGLVKTSMKEGRQSIAIVGDMRELGSIEQSRHEDLAQKLLDIDIDVLIFVGPMCEKYIKPLFEAVGRHALFTFDSREAGTWAKNEIEESPQKSMVFAKGSQNTLFLEEALRIILENEDKKLLVRSDKIWMQKKENFFQSLKN